MARTPKQVSEGAKAEGAKVNEVAVLNKDGQRVRVYTSALHGDKVVENAEEYAAKIGGTTKKLA